jgi:hypothetical protein
VHLAYELVVRNTYQQPTTIRSVTVLDVRFAKARPTRRHLHFHVMDSPDPLVPHAGALVDGIRAKLAPSRQAGPGTGELARFLDVLRFPDGS